MMHADELYNNQIMKITKITLNDEDSQRLFYLGIYPGAQLMRIQKAPMGDPIIFQLQGNRLILRRKDAKHIHGEVMV